ncbi:MAG: hypothetical protein ACOYOK_01470 [Pseudobdellovibrionaceae bacterium]
MSASFQTASFGENPAAALTRDFGVISPSISTTNISQSVPVDSDSIYYSPGWDRVIKIDRSEMFLAGRKYFIVPEIYVSQNTGTIKNTSQTGSTQSEDSMSLFNNQLNLAFRLSSWLHFGVCAYSPKVDYFSKTDYKSNESSYSYQSDNEIKILGLGGGLTLRLPIGFSLGGFYHKIDESREFTFTDSNPINAALNRTGSEISHHEKFGYGLSYQEGNQRSGGFRLEISRSQMNFGSGQIYNNEDIIVPNIQDKIAVEAATLGFVFGVSYTLIQGRYINYRYFVDTLISEFPYYEKAVGVSSGFIGFKTKGGSSIGGLFSYYDGNSEVSFQGQKSTAKVKENSIGISYSYLF